MRSKNQSEKKSLLELASNEQFIHGICNFCNRWCERCSKTQHCLSFAHDQQKNGIDFNQNNNNSDNEKFWNTIDQLLNADSNKLIKNASSKTNTRNPVTDLPEFAEHYGNAVNDWLTTNTTLFEKNNNLVLAKYDHNKSITFSNSIEIIEWYSYFISKRILRSLKDLNERKNGNYKERYSPYRDNLGSAKITLIACNHSIAAFSILYPELDNQQNKIQLFISDLIQIKYQVLQLFPEAMQFKRPGFDD